MVWPMFPLQLPLVLIDAVSVASLTSPGTGRVAAGPGVPHPRRAQAWAGSLPKARPAPILDGYRQYLLNNLG